MSMLNHYPEYCEIKDCKNEAGYWIDFPEKSFYLCDDHYTEVANDEGNFSYITPTNEIREREIGVYSCNEICEVCN
jgi:hypothetical protein